MPDTIVHIGFPKTATTFLQWNVFPNLKGVHYVPYSKCSELFRPIIYSDPLDYSIDKLIAQLDQTSGNTLYSFEPLVGSPFYFKGIGRSNIPYTLKEMGFNKVIITIRDQIKAIDSYYRQYVVQGGTLNFKNWLDIDNKRPLPQKYFQMGYLEYQKLVNLYAEVFGKQNVLLLTQELLKKDASVFIEKIGKFTNSSYQSSGNKRKANESLSNLSITLLRFINHFTFSSVRPFHLISKRISNRPIWKIFAVILDPYFIRFFSKKRSFVNKHQLEERLLDFYKESNMKLEDEWGIDLSK